MWRSCCVRSQFSKSRWTERCLKARRVPHVIHVALWSGCWIANAPSWPGHECAQFRAFDLKCTWIHEKRTAFRTTYSRNCTKFSLCVFPSLSCALWECGNSWHTDWQQKKLQMAHSEIKASNNISLHRSQFFCFCYFFFSRITVKDKHAHSFNARTSPGPIRGHAFLRAECSRSRTCRTGKLKAWIKTPCKAFTLVLSGPW